MEGVLDNASLHVGAGGPGQANCTQITYVILNYLYDFVKSQVSLFGEHKVNSLGQIQKIVTSSGFLE